MTQARIRSRALRIWAGGRVYLVPVILLLAVTLPHLDQGEFRTDTGWYSAIGLQAWRTNSLWTLYGEPGQPYFNKPPLVFWIHGVVLHIFGVSLWAARLPTILAAAGCVMVTVALCRLFTGRAAALATGCVLALSLEFFRRTREISLDMWMLLFMLLGLYFAARATVRRSPRCFLVAGLWVGLALLCKPIVPFLVPVIVLTWLAGLRAGWPNAPHAATRNPSPRWRESLIGPALMVLGAIVVAAPWHLSMASLHGRAFTDAYFGAEIASRAVPKHQSEHWPTKPPWFYLSQIARTYWPWLALVALAAWTWARGMPLARDMRGIALAALWTIIWLAAVSAFADRRDRYALPIYSGLAILAGCWLARVPTGKVRRIVRVTGHWTPIGAAAFGVTASLLPLRFHAPPDPQWAQLFDWLDDHGRPELWQGAFHGDRGARLYLEFERWPITTRNRWGEFIIDRATEPPSDALIIYHRRDGLAPGHGEEVLWTVRELTVTRLTEPPWSPIETPDPGEWPRK